MVLYSCDRIQFPRKEKAVHSGFYKGIFLHILMLRVLGTIIETNLPIPSARNTPFRENAVKTRRDRIRTHEAPYKEGFRVSGIDT